MVISLPGGVPVRTTVLTSTVWNPLVNYNNSSSNNNNNNNNGGSCSAQLQDKTSVYFNVAAKKLD